MALKPVSSIRERFEDSKEKAELDLRQKAWAAAGRVAYAIARGAPFDHVDFVFALSGGQPSEYQKLARVLGQASQLHEGQVVAQLDSQGRIDKVGITSDRPLVMTATTRSDQPPELSNCMFNAHVSLTTEASPGYGNFPPSVQIGDRPYQLKLTLLDIRDYSWGWKGYEDTNFDPSKTLIVDVAGRVRAAEASDERYRALQLEAIDACIGEIAVQRFRSS